MDDRHIEAALRAAPPDEPAYRGGVATRMRERSTASGEIGTTGSAFEVVELAPRRGRRLLAIVGAVAAAMMLVVALARINEQRDHPAATVPTTRPTPSSAPPPSERSSFVGRWVGATPRSLTTPNPDAPAFVVLADDGASLEYFAGGIVNDFNSQLTSTGRDRVRLVLIGQVGRCASGAIGEYRWTVSPGGTRLTIDAISDECTARSAALPGMWNRVACPVRGRDCLGPLESGRYSSVAFDPFDTGSYGQVTYEVPDGWASTVDDKDRLTLLPPSAGDPELDGLSFLGDVTAATDCQATPTAVDLSSIASDLGAVPGVSVTSTSAIVGGFEARVIDLSADGVLACDGRQPLLAARAGVGTPWTLAIGAGERTRIALVDLGGDHTMAIVIRSDAQDAGFGQRLDDFETLIGSLTLTPTPA